MICGPSAANAKADGITKNEILRNATAMRARSCAWGVSPTASRDRSGKDAAATAVPNRLIGSCWTICAYVRLASPPSPVYDPRKVSTRPDSWATPAPRTSGSHAMMTSRTPSGARLTRSAIPPSSFQQEGSWMAICSTLPRTVPHASASDRRYSC